MRRAPEWEDEDDRRLPARPQRTSSSRRRLGRLVDAAATRRPREVSSGGDRARPASQQYGKEIRLDRLTGRAAARPVVGRRCGSTSTAALGRARDSAAADRRARTDERRSAVAPARRGGSRQSR
ncbi:hypothetical protein Syun_004099 [Stephania yunnanensis]|uniref:Uncharacterized protein n=1 Tax=Stephania yunnanensis TaxID=152371 RepID=A0AAP0L2D5_9MAGN